MQRVGPQFSRVVPCPIAFVGEAPGEDEVQKGGLHLSLARSLWPKAGWTGNGWKDAELAKTLPALPLVGPSGRTFNAMLRAAEIDRLDCFVTNVFDEKAPDNDVSEWIKDVPRWEAALARLTEELNAAQPTVIVPLGGTALRAFTGLDWIAKLRGQVQAAEFVRPGAKLVPTFHPAYINRQWADMPLAIGDLIKARHEVTRGPAIRWPKRQFWIEPTLEDLHAWTARCDSSALLSVDIETGWGQITCIGFAPDEENALVVPFWDFRKLNRSYWATPEDEAAAWAWVRDRLEGPAPKLGQNYGAYDAYWLLAKMGMRTMNLLHDTRLMQHARFPEAPKDLASLAAAYSDMPTWKIWSSRTKEDKRDA